MVSSHSSSKQPLHSCLCWLHPLHPHLRRASLTPRPPHPLLCCSCLLLLLLVAGVLLGWLQGVLAIVMKTVLLGVGGAGGRRDDKGTHAG